MISTCWPCVHPVLADGRAGVRRDVLVARRVGGGRGHDRGVLHRAGVLQRLADLGDGGALLADRHVDALDLAGRVAGLPVRPLVDDRVDGDGGLAGLPVADDQLALAAADRGHRVDRLDPGLQRLLHLLALHHRRRLQSPAARSSVPSISPLPSSGLPERVHHPAEEAVADRDGQHLAGAPDLLALLDLAEVAEDDHADLAHVQVERQAADAAGNSSSSFAMAEGSPSTRAMPSPHSATMPTSSLEAPSGSYAWTKLASASRISSGRIVSSAMVLVSLLRRFPARQLGRWRRMLPLSVACQAASLRRSAARRLATLPSMSSSPIWTDMPPTTAGSITTFRWTSCP